MTEKLFSGLQGFCKSCERPTSEEEAVCPHCGQQAPLDRYEDLELGCAYAAEYKGMPTGDICWFKLKPSGRRVFVKFSSADVAREVFHEVRSRNAEHVLELVSFDGGYPNFRYKGPQP